MSSPTHASKDAKSSDAKSTAILTPAEALATPDEAQAHWYAVHTCSRHEKQVYQYMLAADVEPFLPLREERRKWKDRWKWVQFPLFPGYLFVRGGIEQIKRVRTIRGVAQVLGDGRGNVTPVPEKQIEHVRIMVDSGLRIEPYPHLKKGMLVRVLRGPLMGIEGVFVCRKSGDRIVISVDLIAKSVATEIDISDVEPI